MMKICPECGGLGYIEFADYDYEENILDSGIKITCDLCQGGGQYEVKSTKLFVKVYKDGRILKRLFFDVQDTVSRPNNPEWYEILESYLLYHYGTEDYECEEMEEVIEIDDQWNIEDYR